jgi:N-acetylmuramic acid 6-phosphate etherase
MPSMLSFPQLKMVADSSTSALAPVEDSASSTLPECPPTFGTPFGLIEGYIAGGKEAMFRAQEGAEDYEENGAKDVLAAKVSRLEVVCGIAASRRTPVVAQLKKLKKSAPPHSLCHTNPRENFDIKEVISLSAPTSAPKLSWAPLE